MQLHSFDLNYVRFLASTLRQNPCKDKDIFREVLYPLLDQILQEGEELEVVLESGLVVKFLFISGLAKEIVLRDKEIPSHVWEPMTTMLIQNLLSERPGNALICGAYFGDQALPAALALKSSRQQFKVLAVEPNESQNCMLRKNIAINKLTDTVIPVNAFLWEKEGERLKLDHSDSLATVYPDKAGTLSKTIDSIVKENCLPGLSLIVLDIEGSELNAFRGCSELLAQNANNAPDLIFEVNSRFVDWSKGLENTDIVKYVNAFGYQVMALRDGQTNYDFKLDKPEVIPLEEVYLEGPPHGFNLVASKRVGFFDKKNFYIVGKVSPKYLRHRDPCLHQPLHSAKV